MRMLRGLLVLALCWMAEGYARAESRRHLRVAEYSGSQQSTKREPRKDKSMPTIFWVSGLYTSEKGTGASGYLDQGQIVPGDELEVLGKTRGTVRVESVEVVTQKLVFDPSHEHKVPVIERRAAKAKEHANLTLATPGAVPRARSIRAKLYWLTYRDGGVAGPNDPPMVKSVTRDTRITIRVNQVNYSATLLRPSEAIEPPQLEGAPPIPPTPTYEIPEWTIRFEEPIPVAVGIDLHLDFDNLKGVAGGMIIGAVE